MRSYDDPAWIGRGESTASQTAWALLALLAAGERLGAGATRGRLAGRAPARRRRLGRDRSSPAPGSPATSTSTTTCTGWSSRSARSAAMSRAATIEAVVVCTPLRVECAGARGGRLRPPCARHRAVPAGGGRCRDRHGAGRWSPASPAALAPRLAPGDVVVASRCAIRPATPCPARPRRCSRARCAGAGSRSTSGRSSPRRDASAPAAPAGRSPRRCAGGRHGVGADRRAGPGRAFAVVRAIVDTADAPLLHPGTSSRGVGALRACVGAAPSIDAGRPPLAPRDPAGLAALVLRRRRARHRHRRASDRTVRCSGLRAPSDRAQRARGARARAAGRGLRARARRGAAGARAVLAAHGVAPEVRGRRRDRGSPVVDATCPLVAKVHRRYAATPRAATPFS